MVNKEKRAIASNLIQRLASAEITNDDFEDQFPRDSKDRALRAIYWRLWFFYDDHKEHTLTGEHALNQEGIELFDRCREFLATDLEYEWPSISPSAFLILLRILGLRSVTQKQERREMNRLNSFGDFDSWPFLRSQDLHLPENALK